ncbi:MAG: type III-B CRISPR module RAMP protein Cmr6, partial [Thermoguttaceae bacterium]|nr:type III-B CRISPR module RAMP protein Cmr6 [Thermoguttaceae bacterium]
MAIGVVEIREVEERDNRGRNQRVKKPFVQGTNREITPNSVRTGGWGALAFDDLATGLDIEYEERGQSAVADVRRYAAVPVGVRRILDSHGCDHTGLALDKFIYRSADQSFVKHALLKVVGVNHERAPNTQWFLDLRNRWMATTNQRENSALRCTTIGPLTLHLARASAMENAGICLHPIYGFAYLPGSGLKGMARAYAETVWLPTQPDQKQAWRQIEDVFGWASNPDRLKQMKDPNHPAQVRRQHDDDPCSPEIKASSGNIVFHDAWPECWPQLIVDIVNNHHREYYRARPDDNDHPPGDWENPEPVYFLAVKPGTTFNFPLAKRRSDVANELLDLARQWLLGALCHLGAGAKTASGYGAFEPAAEVPPTVQSALKATWQAAQSGPSLKRAVFETTLELVTPAFLAGPNQQADDCDLRPATLRGLLRWWWRTLHAACVDVKTLRALEVAVWGDTESGGPVRITVQRDHQSPLPIPVLGKCVKKDKKNRDVLRPDQDFMDRMKLERPPNSQTTPGFLYLSYGMDEMPAGKPGERKQRFMIPPGAKWHIQLAARDGYYRAPGSNPKAAPVRLPAPLILRQAQAALWLLSHYGGVGSKGRNGFGSLAQIGESDDEHKRAEFERVAADFRQKCGAKESQQAHAEIASLKDVLPILSIPTPWKSYWFVLDQLGYSIQAFAQKHKRNWIKEALGLPRKIG